MPNNTTVVSDLKSIGFLVENLTFAKADTLNTTYFWGTAAGKHLYFSISSTLCASSKDAFIVKADWTTEINRGADSSINLIPADNGFIAKHNDGDISKIVLFHSPYEIGDYVNELFTQNWYCQWTGGWSAFTALGSTLGISDEMVDKIYEKLFDCEDTNA
jgi:hypothetical protein